MSSQLLFETRESAVVFLENARRGSNYMAESHQDRVNAQNAIRYFDGWSPPPLRDIPRPEPRRRKSA